MRLQGTGEPQATERLSRSETDAKRAFALAAVCLLATTARALTTEQLLHLPRDPVQEVETLGPGKPCFIEGGTHAGHTGEPSKARSPVAFAVCADYD
mgnify:FL=1